jgi:glycosyltransferase involved in cell wall biosynthesis
MDILHVCPSRSFSGLEQYAFELATYQRRRGLDVGFVVCPGSPLESECQREGIQTVDFLYDSWRGRWFFWRRVTRILNKEKDLKAIHLHMTDEVANISVPIFWRRLRKLWNKRPKIIFQAHIWMSRRKKDFYHRLLYSNIDEVWCSSKPAKAALTKALPSNVEVIKIFNYGRDVKRLKEEILDREDSRKYLKLKSGRTTLGTVSRIEKAKGIRELIDAAKPLLEKDHNLELVIIGGPSPNNPEAEEYFSKIQSEISRLSGDLRDRIILKGPVPESHRFLKAFDLYVLPSYLETFSLALLDAQLAGLPVVGSKSGGTPEVVKEDETGWLFTPESVKSLKEVLSLALSKKDLFEEFGKRAKSRVEKEFNQKEIFEAITKAYSEKTEKPKSEEKVSTTKPAKKKRRIRP